MLAQTDREVSNLTIVVSRIFMPVQDKHRIEWLLINECIGQSDEVEAEEGRKKEKKLCGQWAL